MNPESPTTPILRTAYILGAGFSMALNPVFPNTDQLGELVRHNLSEEDSLKMPPGKFWDGRFEEWLSYLAESQPHHDEASEHEAIALLIRITQVIQEVLSDVQRTALNSDAPSWLYRLLGILHSSRASVISTNYDNMIECGVTTMGLWSQGTYSLRSIGEEDILGGMPKSAVPKANNSGFSGPFDFISEPLSIDNSLADSFHLMKLHGSLNWYWLPFGNSGSSLRRWYLPGRFGEVWNVDDDLRRRELPSHEVFLVPPSSLKGGRLHEAVTREIWKRAAIAIQEADRLVIMGYSAPPADTSFRGLVAECVGRRDLQLEIVNPQGKLIADRLQRMGIPSQNVNITEGIDCIDKWVTQEVDRQTFLILESIRTNTELTREERMYVDHGDVKCVSKIERTGSRLILRLEPNNHPSSQAHRLSELIDVLEGATSIGIETDGSFCPIIGYWTMNQPNGFQLKQIYFHAVQK